MIRVKITDTHVRINEGAIRLIKFKRSEKKQHEVEGCTIILSDDTLRISKGDSSYRADNVPSKKWRTLTNEKQSWLIIFPAILSLIIILVAIQFTEVYFLPLGWAISPNEEFIATASKSIFSNYVLVIRKPGHLPFFWSWRHVSSLYDIRKVKLSDQGVLYNENSNGSITVVHSYDTYISEPIHKLENEDALIKASNSGNMDRIKFLIKNGADVNKADENGWTPLITASHGGHKAAVEFLISKGADIDYMQNNFPQWTAIVAASAGGKKDIVELLLNSVSTVDHKDEALVAASCAGEKAIVELLISKGANTKFINNDGKTALFYARYHNHKEIAEILTAIDHNVDKVDWLGKTPLIYATASGLKKDVEDLIKRGADVNKKGAWNKTALMFASSHGYMEITELLLDSGAEIDKADVYGWTSLMHASSYGHKDIVELFLNKGADKNLVNDVEKTAFDMALQNNCIEIAEMLVNFKRRKLQGEPGPVVEFNKQIPIENLKIDMVPFQLDNNGYRASFSLDGKDLILQDKSGKVIRQRQFKTKHKYIQIATKLTAEPDSEQICNYDRELDGPAYLKLTDKGELLLQSDSTIFCNIFPNNILKRGQYFTKLENDEVLVEFFGHNCQLKFTKLKTPAKTSYQFRNGVSCELIMQRDGNLVAYNNNGKPVWSSNTYGDNDLKLLDDGRLCIQDIDCINPW